PPAWLDRSRLPFGPVTFQPRSRLMRDLERQAGRFLRPLGFSSSQRLIRDAARMRRGCAPSHGAKTWRRPFRVRLEPAFRQPFSPAQSAASPQQCGDWPRLNVFVHAPPHASAQLRLSCPNPPITLHTPPRLHTPASFLKDCTLRYAGDCCTAGFRPRLCPL